MVLFTDHQSYFLLCFCICSFKADLRFTGCNAPVKKHQNVRYLQSSLLSAFHYRRFCSSRYPWKRMFAMDGVVNKLLGSIGIKTSISWLGDTKTAIWILILLAVWQFGSSMLIFLSSLKQIPTSLYEAAMVDGANPVSRFFKITLPLLTPTIFFNLVMQMINGFLAFTQCYIITQGKPMNSTLLYTVYMYQQSFEFYNTGYGAAMAWVMLLMIGLITLFLFATKRFWVYEGGL